VFVLSLFPFFSVVVVVSVVVAGGTSFAASHLLDVDREVCADRWPT
jgi:hypothetical protein